MFLAAVFIRFLKNSRLLAVNFFNCLTRSGCIMIWKIPASYPWGRLVGVWFIVWLPAANTFLFSLIVTNIAGCTKKRLLVPLHLLFIYLVTLFRRNYLNGHTPEYIEEI